MPRFYGNVHKKKTKIVLESLAGVNMILDYNDAIKGGITRAICHYAEANNKYMHDYDEV